MSKDIILKQFNGTSYDELYPKTNVTQASSSQEINEYYGLASDATFSDVLKAIPEDVGTIKYSVKSLSQMGDKYLLCDGSAVDSAKYSELASYLSSKSIPSASSDFVEHTITIDTSFVNSTVTVSRIQISCFNYINGYYVFQGYVLAQGGSSTREYFRLFYSKSLDTPFVSANVEPVYSINYCNGYIVVFHDEMACRTETSSSSYATTKLTCSVAVDPSGSWTAGPTVTTDAISSDTTYLYGPCNIIYDGSKYIFSFSYHLTGNYANFFGMCSYSSLLQTDPDESFLFPSSESGYLSKKAYGIKLFYRNGYYIFINPYRYTMYYSSVWNGTYSSVSLGSSQLYSVAEIVYFNNRWYVFCGYSSSTVAYISSDSSIDSSYTETTVSSNALTFANSTNYGECVYLLSNNKGQFLAFQEGIFFFANGGTEYNFYYAKSGSAPFTTGIIGISNNGCFVSQLDYLGTSVTLNTFTQSSFLPVIPSISTANAYIKALPGK